MQKKQIFSTTNVKLVKIVSEYAKQRIDNYLLSKLKNIPKSIIYKMLRKGNIRINKKRIPPKYKLKSGDIIRLPPIFIKKKKIFHNISIAKNQLNLSQYIIYEDKYLLLLNKPSGFAVHGGSGIQFGIIELLRKNRPKEQFLELVHRLDKCTSGILLISKKKKILRNLHEQIRKRKIKKKYIALVKGKWPNVTKVSIPLKKVIMQRKKKIYVNENGKKSITFFKIKKRYQSYTLMSIFPITGRTHQIRVHCSYIGHPIVLDKIYGFKSKKKFPIKNLTNERILLHAKSIEFFHPYYKKNMLFKIHIDKLFKEILKNIHIY